MATEYSGHTRDTNLETYLEMKRSDKQTEKEATGPSTQQIESNTKNRLDHPHPHHAMQQSVGNQAVKALYERGAIQAKLEVSNPNDPAEREAERVAEELFGGRSVISRNTAGSNTDCFRSASSQGGPISTDEQRQVQSAINGGNRLPDSTRERFERQFGRSFDDVRIHSDVTANEAAQSIQAKAFTLGNDIVFRQGEYNPRSAAGTKLLAHELTHVVQDTAPNAVNQRSEVVQPSVTRVGRHGISRQYEPSDAELIVDATIESGKFLDDLHSYLNSAEELVESLENAGEQFSEEGSGWFGTSIRADEGSLAAAEQLFSIAGDLSEVTENLAEYSNDLNKLAMGEESDRLGTVSNTAETLGAVLSGAEAMAILADNTKQQAFLDDPNDSEAAAEWGAQAAGYFDTAADAISLLPNHWTLRMMEGYLRAPSNYVEVFTAIMHRRQQQIDDLTGHRPASMRVNQYDWIGELSPIYASGTRNGLSEFMEAHRNVGGIDLEEDTREITLPHLRGLIERTARENPNSRAARRRDDWLEILDAGQ